MFKMLCAGGPISMSTRLSRSVVLLTALVFAVPTVGPTMAEAQADAPDAANLYPGRYAAVCIPAPMFGCVCTRDPRGEALMFTELDSTADHHLKDIGDTEYLRMIAWLRRTCASLTQSVAHPVGGSSVSRDCAGVHRTKSSARQRDNGESLVEKRRRTLRQIARDDHDNACFLFNPESSRAYGTAISSTAVY